MSALRYSVDGALLNPEHPTDRRVEPRGVVLEMPYNDRFYSRGETVTLTLRDGNADEATWAIWKAIRRTVEIAVIEPDGTNLLMRVTAWEDSIVGSTPTANEGTTSATGTVTRALALTLRGRVV